MIQGQERGLCAARNFAAGFWKALDLLFLFLT